MTDTSDMPPFDIDVVGNGYRWWYLDAASDDGRYALVVIAFIGSVFSPYYFRARRAHDERGAVPENHCALNIALYEPRRRWWAMTERSRSSLARSSTRLAIGPSLITCHGDRLDISIAERTAPFARRLVGHVRVHLGHTQQTIYPLSSAGGHGWQPIAPAARVEAEFAQPALRFSGAAYLDSNAGDRPLEADFSSWHWSRRHVDGQTEIHYDVTGRGGETRAIALGIDGAGRCYELADAALQPLPATHWGIARAARSRTTPRVSRTLEDTPFYARSLLAADPADPANSAAAGHMVHESLSLDRFRRAWVRTLLPFRMPRVTKP